MKQIEQLISARDLRARSRCGSVQERIILWQNRSRSIAGTAHSTLQTTQKQLLSFISPAICSS